jgi:hypothetical protein
MIFLLRPFVRCFTSIIVACDLCVPCSTKIEKEKKEHAKQHGMIRTEFSGGEIAEEMEKERRLFQFQMCEVRGCVPLARSQFCFAGITIIILFLFFSPLFNQVGPVENRFSFTTATWPR